MATAVQARHLASPAIRILLRRRMAEVGGLGLGLGGIAVLVALVYYNPQDPSLNTATSQHATNLAGSVGAFAADLLLQSFGLASILPGIIALAWAYRIATHRGLGNFPLRLIAILAALPTLAALFSALPVGEQAWPTLAGLGGAAGHVAADAALGTGQSVLGPLGAGLVWVALSLLGLGLTWLSLGLSTGEWRAFGIAAHGLIVRGHRFLDWLSRTITGSVWVARRLGQRQDKLRLLQPLQDIQGSRKAESSPIMGMPRPAVAQTEISPFPIQVRPKVAANVRKIASRQENLPLAETGAGGWRTPPLSLLKSAPARNVNGPSEDALQANARLLESVLDEYGVQGTIKEIRPGPVVTLYELEPAPGIRSARVIGLADDVARSLSVTAVRIATVPGRNVIGIEIPNAKRETVFLSELLGAEAWDKHPARLALALGKDIGGEPVLADLARMPHLLVAGTTGSGKSVGINAMILSLLYRLSPDQCRMILIDPKMLELSVYDGIPHLMAPVVTEPAKAVTALKWTVREMERRYRAMSQLGVRNVGGYNERVVDARAKGEVVTRRVQTGFDSETGKPTFEEQPLTLEPLPFLVVIIDEMADLMMVAGKEIEAAVQRLAQMARAAGIHVVMATQRPSVDVITGTIKANFPTRISFTVISKFDSRTILGEQGAEQLLGQGDMLYQQGGGRISRVHGPFVSDREVEDVVAFLREQAQPHYLEEVTETQDEEETSVSSSIVGASDAEKGLFDQAVALVSREGKASTSFIQRHLAIGYNRAAKLIEQMEKEGIVSPANHVGKRDVLTHRSDD